ncbi:MAG: alpha/beta hydrolase [Mycoplasma sp.]|nr:alpha/beta hydrolase [Mycoplasma sp.]
MYKNKKINKQKVRIYSKNNKSKTTILFVHGFASSNMFASKLYKLKNSFNIVSIDLYNSEKPEEIDFKLMSKVAEGVLKKIRSKNIVVLGHSLGGGILSNIYDKSPNIKQIIWMATINPFMINHIVFKTLKAHHDEEGSKLLSKVSELIKSRIEKASEKSEDASPNWILKFLDKDSPWAKVMHETIFDDKFISHLDKAYKNTVNKSLYIIGEKDGVVATKVYTKYVNQIGGSPINIGKSHNPINDNPELINNVLNDIAEDIKGKSYLPMFKIF